MSEWKGSWGTSNVSFGGAFWAEASKDSPIDELLAKVRDGEEVPLERVLDEQSVLQEVTAMNEELINFLLEHLAEMLDYIVLGRNNKATEPDAQFDHSNEHYAYISCEIFCVNNNSITNAILRNEAHLERLFQILEQPAPLSPRSAGYFHMFLLLLCQREPNAILRFASKDRPMSFSIGPAALTEDANLVNRTLIDPSTDASHLVENNKSVEGATTASVKSDTDRGAKRRFDDDDAIQEPSGKRAPVSQQPPSFVDSSIISTPLKGGSNGHMEPAPSIVSSTPKRPNMGLVPAFLRHVDSYSIACAFMVLLQAAAEQTEIAQDPTLSRSIHSMQLSSIGDVKTPKPSISPEEGELLRARKLWTGGYGTASAVLAILREHDDSYSHSNAADLLSELYRRAAATKKLHVENMRMASLHFMDDEQQAPFAINEEEFIARQQELTFAGLKDFASPVGSPSTDGVGAEWTVTGIDELCNLIVSSQKLNSATDAATRVLSAVVIAYTQPFSGGDLFSSKQESCPEIDRLVRRLPEIVAKLTPEDEESDLLDTQWGGRIARLGMGRLLLIEVISHLILCGHKAVAKEMAYMDCDPVKCLLDMFFKFEWNNVLHSIVERTIRAILQGSTPTVRSISALPFKDTKEQDANNQKAEKERMATLEALLPLQQKSLFSSKPNLLERILDAYDSNAAAVRVVEERYVRTTQGGGANGEVSAGVVGDATIQRASRSGQKGYMGHLRNIANACAELIENQNQSGGPAIDAIDEDLKQRWFDFVNGKLAESNQIVSKPLGGGPQVKKDPFQPSPVLAALSSPFLAEENFFSSKVKLGTERSRNLDLELEPDLDEDDDDEDDEDPEETMRRYYERKADMTRELERQSQMVASSPQDSSWVVDFGSDEPTANGGGNDSTSGDAGGAAGIFFDSAPTFDPGFFNPLSEETTVASVTASLDAFDPFAGEPSAAEGNGADDADDFDPFGTEGAKSPTYKPTTSAPISMPAPSGGAGPNRTTGSNDDLGVTPPGFEFIDKVF